jgi:hypothetical protein
MRDGVCQHNADPGYPLTNRNWKSVAEVHELMQCNERFAICEMADEFLTVSCFGNEVSFNQICSMSIDLLECTEIDKNFLRILQRVLKLL